jgi:opacity protein-like surface antigen
MTRLAIIAALAIAAATPALAQTWQQYQIGSGTYYNGSDGTTGYGYQIGRDQYTDFTSPNGQMTRCHSYTIGSTVYTNCN